MMKSLYKYIFLGLLLLSTSACRQDQTTAQDITPTPELSQQTPETEQEQKDDKELEPTPESTDEAEADTIRKQIADLALTLPDENGQIETKLVPDTMQPGSCIYFISDNVFIILKGDIYYDTEEKVEERREQWLAQVEAAEARGAIVSPDTRPAEGMFVHYGSDGHAHRIYSDLTLEEAQTKADSYGQ